MLRPRQQLLTMGENAEFLLEDRAATGTEYWPGDRDDAGLSTIRGILRRKQPAETSEGQSYAGDHKATHSLFIPTEANGDSPVALGQALVQTHVRISNSWQPLSQKVRFVVKSLHQEDGAREVLVRLVRV